MVEKIYDKQVYKCGMCKSEMRKYFLAIVIFMLILTVAGFFEVGVLAKMIAISPDGFNHDVEVYVRKGWNLILTTPIVGTSPGDDYADDVINSDSEVERDNIKAVYYYIRDQNKYISVYPEDKEFTNYIKNNQLLDAKEEGYYAMLSSVWVYSDKNGVLKYHRIDVPKYDMIVLKAGWNFLTITPEMKGKTLNELSGNCELLKVYHYESVVQRWSKNLISDLFMDEKLTDDSIGVGLVVRVPRDCKLGEISGIETPPSIPN